MTNLIPFIISENYKKNKFKGSFQAFTMFVDISGFTSLTEKLMKDKKSGSESLAIIINSLFQPIVKNIYNNGGMITGFAGDAFTAIFKEDFGSKSILSSAYFINTFLEKENQKNKFSTKLYKIKIHVKIGLSFGRVEWGILDAGKINKYYFRGEAITCSIISEKRSKKDEIISDISLINKLSMDEKKSFTKLDSKFYKFDYSNNNPLQLALTNCVGSNQNKISTLKRSDFTPFLIDSVISTGIKAEFKNIVCTFISFEEPKTDEKLLEIAGSIAEMTYIYGGYSRLDFGDKGFNYIILFGAPKSYENNIERALEFILRIKQKFENLHNLKAGITYGTVYTGIIGGKERGEYSAIGNIVNLSARLMVKANWNDIFVNKLIFEKMNNTYNFKKTGTFVYKGILEKTQTYKLIEKKDIITDKVDNGVLIGRKKELSILEKFINPIFKNKFVGITYLYGEAGLGKSHLTSELKTIFQLSITNCQLNWFYMPCEQILKKSFNPILYFLKKYFSVTDSKSKLSNKSFFNRKFKSLILSLKKKLPQKLIGVNKKDVNEIISELKRTKSIIGGYLDIAWKKSLYNDLDSKNRYDNFIFAIKNLIKGISLLNPVVIEIDDTHWIDNDSKRFFMILTRNIENFPIALICPTRFDDNGNDFEIEVDKSIKKNKIKLEFFIRKEIQDYAKIVLKTEYELSNSFLSFLKEKTNGNPFFIEQILLDLNDKNLILKNKTVDAKDNSIQYKLTINSNKLKNIPSTIQSIIISRIDNLSNNVKEIVQTASVIGRKFLIKVLDETLKENSGEICNENNYKTLEQKNIWISLSKIRYLFKHSMLRDSAYKMQIKSILKEKHKTIASSYEKLYEKNIKMFYNEIAFHFDKSSSKKEAAKYLEKAGDYAKENYENEKALEFYNKLLSKYKLSKKKTIDISLKNAEILKLTGEFNLSINILNDIYSIAKDLNDKARIQKILSLKGSLFYYTGKVDKAMKTFKSQLIICKEINDKKGIANALGTIGVLNQALGNYKEAINFQNKKLDICNKLDDKIGLASAFGNLGNIFSDMGDTSKEIDFYKKSLKYSLEIDDQIGISGVFNNIGLFYQKINDDKKAMEFFKKRIDLCNKLGDKKGLALTLGNLGMVFSDRKEYGKAMKHYNKYLEISTELDDKAGRSIALGNIGNLYEIQGDLDKALNCHSEKLKIKEELNEQRGISITLGNLGNVYSAKKIYIQALNFYDKALLIDKKLNLVDLNVYHLLDKAQCLYYLARYKDALEINSSALIQAQNIEIKDLTINLKNLKKKIEKKLSQKEKK